MIEIKDIRERSLAISRYADASISSGGLTTSIVAVTTNVERGGQPVIGYGFSSIGRFAQSGLIRERFARRLLAAEPLSFSSEDATNIDPMLAWNVMMAGEKPGGHGERCVAVGTLDMALWDAAAKIADRPLYAFIRKTLDCAAVSEPQVTVYASGGYRYPSDDIARLIDEVDRVRGLGYTRMKIKIGAVSLFEDARRIQGAASALGSPDLLAVDAMNAYDRQTALKAAGALRSTGCWWFEDVTDPLDFETWAEIARIFPYRIAAGESLFSAAEAELLARYSGLRPERDILLFDPVHTYGLPGYLAIIDRLQARGWRKRAWWPHGGHLFALHVAAALELAGSEMNPFSFQPFGGVADDMKITDGSVTLPTRPGIGFEYKSRLHDQFLTLDERCIIT